MFVKPSSPQCSISIVDYFQPNIVIVLILYYTVPNSYSQRREQRAINVLSRIYFCLCKSIKNKDKTCNNMQGIHTC